METQLESSLKFPELFLQESGVMLKLLAFSPWGFWYVFKYEWWTLVIHPHLRTKSWVDCSYYLMWVFSAVLCVGLISCSRLPRNWKALWAIDAVGSLSPGSFTWGSTLRGARSFCGCGGPEMPEGRALPRGADSTLALLVFSRQLLVFVFFNLSFWINFRFREKLQK